MHLHIILEEVRGNDTNLSHGSNIIMQGSQYPWQKGNATDCDDFLQHG